MGLDVNIESCCRDPRYHLKRWKDEPVKVHFGNEGQPIVDYIQNELGHTFKDNLDIIHLKWNEFRMLVDYLELNVEWVGKLKFIGDSRWYELGIMIGCCQDCGVDVYASW